MSARAALAAALVAACIAGCAVPHPGRRVQIENAWVRSSAPFSTAGAAYFTLTSPDGDQLVGVSVPPDVARFALVHETVRTPGAGGSSVLGMRHVVEVDLPAGRPVDFAPGDRHVMLIALTKPLLAGDSVSISLAFKRAPAETLQVPVRDE